MEYVNEDGEHIMEYGNLNVRNGECFYDDELLDDEEEFEDENHTYYYTLQINVTVHDYEPNDNRRNTCWYYIKFSYTFDTEKSKRLCPFYAIDGYDKPDEDENNDEMLCVIFKNSYADMLISYLLMDNDELSENIPSHGITVNDYRNSLIKHIITLDGDGF